MFMNAEKTKRVVFDSKLMAEREYWLERLSTRDDRSALRTDLERPTTHAALKQVIEVPVPESLRRKLIKATNDSAFLLYTMLMAGLKICLYKYTGNISVIVGSPSRRQDGEASQFNNALAILDQIDGQSSFREFLMQVRENLTQAYARQRYPLARLIKDLGLESTVGRCPLFDVALALKNIHDELPELGNDLTLMFHKSPDGITCEVEYESALFKRETIERFTGHLMTLLSTALENVDRPISTLDILSASERRQLLLTWNQTQAALPPHQCLHHLFEAQARDTPLATALLDQDEQLTYAELNRRANQLAHYLLKLGVGREVLVAVCLNDSPRLIVALLAILKAGGAYVPLDPSLPLERLTFMQKDTGGRFLLSEQSLLAHAPTCAATIVCLDSQWEEISRYSIENPESGARPDNLAYIIYTSGSTGNPKGVMVEHRGVCNMVWDQLKQFEIGPETRLLQFASLSFDASVSEIFTALIGGATLCLRNRETGFSGSGLVQMMRDLGITVVTLPPTMLSTAPMDSCQSLKTIVSAGESCSAEIVERCAPGRRFINAYGPTETSVCASLWVCQDIPSGPPPVGRPIANMQIYLLDQDRQPVPVNVQGEIYIGGIGVARGYLHRPDLTAERFVPNPFSDEPGARLYRTGDAALYLPDGQIEYLGRLDHQVKIRGHRIEPGEIETALRQHPSVRDAVVVDRASVDQGTRLVAYVISSVEETLNVGELHGFLKDKLPEYMLPPNFVALREFPLTASGKIDRTRLPAPEQSRPALTTNYEAPRTTSEQLLVDIWVEVLGVEKIGVHDNFFELGGHSLLVAKVISRVLDLFQVELPVRVLFEAPTVAELNVAVLKSQADKLDLDNLEGILAEIDGLNENEAKLLIGERDGDHP
jgi:amino acid adenylation domain-containing protein